MLDKALVLTARHDWGVEGTKERLTARFATLRRNFRMFIGNTEFTWIGNRGHLTVETLGQTVTALCEVRAHEVNILVKLPWLLAGLAGPIESFLESHCDVLGSTPKPDAVKPIMTPLGYHHRLLWVYRRLMGFASRPHAVLSEAA